MRCKECSSDLTDKQVKNLVYKNLSYASGVLLDLMLIRYNHILGNENQDKLMKAYQIVSDIRNKMSD